MFNQKYDAADSAKNLIKPNLGAESPGNANKNGLELHLYTSMYPPKSDLFAQSPNDAALYHMGVTSRARYYKVL